MGKVNYQNEKMKRKYFDWVQETKGYSDKTMRVKESAIWKYDEYTKYQEYKSFNSVIAKGFKKWLNTRTNEISGKNLSKRTQYHILRHIKDFFVWLSNQSGYKSRVKLDDIAYLRLSQAETRIATSHTLPRYPSLEYIKKLCAFKINNVIDERDRALIAFTAVSAMRDLAIISLPLGCFNSDSLVVEQDPNKGVKTKFSKLIYTTLFKFDKDLIEYVLDWYKYLKNEELFDGTHPLFPSTKMELLSKNEHMFVPKGITKNYWSSAGPMRKIFKSRSEQQGLDYYSPHKFRHFAISEANKYAQGAEQMKAISQNVGHERLATTFYGYGAVDEYRVSDIISDMDFPKN